MAEKAAETEEDVANVGAETVAEEMSENFSEEEAETEKITVKLAETEELVKRKGFIRMPSIANLPILPNQQNVESPKL